MPEILPVPPTPWPQHWRVQVVQVRGSAPRDVGATLVVGQQRIWGTVGGGHLEWQAIALARAALAGGQTQGWRQQWPLGPTLGQCCGGTVELAFAPLPLGLSPDQALEPARLPVTVFGLGHVGRAALAQLALLPCALLGVDGRPEVLAQTDWPTGVSLSDDPLGAVGQLPTAGAVLVMTHRHDLDWALMWALLQRQATGAGPMWLGLIGSASKWASFRRRLLERGIDPAALDRVHCPVGALPLRDKRPEFIALSIAVALAPLLPPAG